MIPLVGNNDLTVCNIKGKLPFIECENKMHRSRRVNKERYFQGINLYLIKVKWLQLKNWLQEMVEHHAMLFSETTNIIIKTKLLISNKIP